MSLGRVILMLMLLLPPMSSPEPLDLGSNKSGSRARFGVNTIPKKNKVSKSISTKVSSILFSYLL